ncbi:hypothetical protein VTJ83DRAFT_5054 [Remersonia thermophila]|uniref:Ubiquitin carrier protein n=1 Tax=Remersonia thermophila TaxID=72144 RepID=A0ABR4DBX0_9PEZI
MFRTTVSVGHAMAQGYLAKRYAEEEQPPFLKLLDTAHLLVVLANIILFLPIFFIIWYTLPSVHVTLAAVEDPLPAYEPVPLDPQDDDAPKDPNDAAGGSHRNRPVTSSLRSTNRVLKSVFGWRAIFLGFRYACVAGAVAFVALNFFDALPFVPFSIAHLLSMLAASPFTTVWVHAVIAAPTPGSEPAKSLRSRLRSYRKIYATTWFPIFLTWAATNAVIFSSRLLVRLIGLPSLDPNSPDFVDPEDRSLVPKSLCVSGVALALYLLLVVPAQTVLQRVQASLLPADEDTIVPFDRSFGGRLEPEVVGGQRFATFGAAFKTVPYASWVRIYLQRAKIFLVTAATYVLVGLLVALQFVLLQKIAGPA